jgi:hypothetical protein
MNLPFADSAVVYLAFVRPQLDSLPIIHQSFSKVNTFFKKNSYFLSQFFLRAEQPENSAFDLRSIYVY